MHPHRSVFCFRALRWRVTQTLLILFLSAPAWSLDVWFIRHAESEFNVVEGALPFPDDGVTYPLTPKGVREAAALGAQFVGVQVDHLYSSTRLRTLLTAAAISLQTGSPVRLAPGAVEVSFGSAPDLGKDAFPVLQRWVEGDADARAHHDGAESLNDLRARFLPFWEQLVAQHGDDDGLLVLVTHGALIMFMLAELCPSLALEDGLLEGRVIGNAEVVKAVLEDGKLRCVSWAGKPIER